MSWHGYHFLRKRNVPAHVEDFGSLDLTLKLLVFILLVRNGMCSDLFLLVTSCSRSILKHLRSSLDKPSVNPHYGNLMVINFLLWNFPVFDSDSGLRWIGINLSHTTIRAIPRKRISETSVQLESQLCALVEGCENVYGGSSEPLFSNGTAFLSCPYHIFHPEKHLPATW